uniref:MADF domain-containing protein n=1 Tax=Heligmosomoides polygyrus TaxID=6339 RepID=A0A183GH00_HELPZ
LLREKISAQHGTDAAGMYRLQFWHDALSAIYGDSVEPVPRLICSPHAKAKARNLCEHLHPASLSLLDSLVVARQQTIGDHPFKTVKDVGLKLSAISVLTLRFQLENYGMSTTGDSFLSSSLLFLDIHLMANLLRLLYMRLPNLLSPMVSLIWPGSLGSCDLIVIGIKYLCSRSFLPLLSKGVVLLPSDLMTLYCLTPGRVYNRKDPEGLVNLVKDLVKVATAHLASSRGFTPSAPRAHRRALAPTSSVVAHIIGGTIEDRLSEISVLCGSTHHHQPPVLHYAVPLWRNMRIAMSAKILKFDPLDQVGMDEKLHLVNVMQAYPELWNERHPAYKDNTKRTMAWNHIKGIMQDSFDKQYQAVDVLADALKEDGIKLDRYELLGLTLASKLRTLREMDPVACEEWMLKTEEFMIPLSRCIRELHKFLYRSEFSGAFNLMLVKLLRFDRLQVF